MTPSMVERAQALAAGTLVAPEPRHASTVVLLRDASSGSASGRLEVHLQRRAATMAFAAGAYVFPGGRVDPGDAPSADGPAPDLPADWVRVLAPGDPPLAAALVTAAVRETFEESGVLLADDLPPDVAADLAAARALPFASLRARGVRPSTRLLAPWGRWVTPEVEPRRYDTRFFVAALPRDQRAAVDSGDLTAGGEADDALWATPQQALARHRDGELHLMPPTSFTLAELAEHADTATVLAAAAGRECRPVLPRVLVDGETVRFLIGDSEQG